MGLTVCFHSEGLLPFVAYWPMTRKLLYHIFCEFFCCGGFRWGGKSTPCFSIIVEVEFQSRDLHCSLFEKCICCPKEYFKHLIPELDTQSLPQYALSIHFKFIALLQVEWLQKACVFPPLYLQVSHAVNVTMSSWLLSSCLILYFWSFLLHVII